MSMEDKKVVLCGSNSYDKKYYFNEKFASVPTSIKDDLKILCVLFTEKVGGILTLVFDENGILALETTVLEDDILYDEIGSGLIVQETRRNKQELFESLNLYYQVIILEQNRKND